MSAKKSWNTVTAPTPPPSLPLAALARLDTRQLVMLSAIGTVTVALPSAPVISDGLT